MLFLNIAPSWFESLEIKMDRLILKIFRCVVVLDRPRMSMYIIIQTMLRFTPTPPHQMNSKANIFLCLI
jgi:hypothetical protein